ncbi:MULTISPECIES: ABC transporter permease [unclassified Devosia]|uniref:ABC transporter permease n=1 Tax=unclassified Devosia TaxID=196773 RepID=UPI00145F6301|nr:MULTISPECIES: ABC transporter permease [unclassified Devosia]MBJ6986788.1 ABC transporter permease [Devosia sp. MC521]QMW63823.1 ABC transporter permease [Devosia sp. MC521]
MSAPASAKGSMISRVGRLVFVIAAALLCGFIMTTFASEDPVGAFKVLLTGAWPEISFEDGELSIKRLTRVGSLLEDATTLTLLGLAVAIPFRAKQFTMGADGQLFFGALAAGAVSMTLQGPSWVVLPAACLAAMTSGFIWGLIPGALKARFGTNEIVATLMLNVIALQFYRFCITYLLRDPTAGFITTGPFPEEALMPILINRTNVTPVIFLAIAAAIIVWLIMRRTKTGFEINLIGENPRFAKYAGVPVRWATALSMGIGGIFAGLAGFHTANGLLKNLPMDLAPGIGFEGMVVALLARNNPLAVPLVALLYAYLRVGAQIMERSTDVTREMVMIIQAFIIIFVVAERFGPALFAKLFQRKAKSSTTEVSA